MKTLKATAVNKHSDQDNRGLKSLSAKLVYLSGDPASIGALGTFLLQCAEEMKEARPFHRHFRDFIRVWDPAIVDVVVDRAPAEAQKKPNKSPQRTRFARR